MTHQSPSPAPGAPQGQRPEEFYEETTRLGWGPNQDLAGEQPDESKAAAEQAGAGSPGSASGASAPLPSPIAEEPPADPPLSSATSARSVEGLHQVKQLVNHAVGLTLLLSTVGTIGLLVSIPALAPWYLGTAALVLANGAVWSWIIRGAFRVEGSSRALLVRGVLAKLALLALILTLVLVLRPISFPARMAVLGGLLTPLLGLVVATQMPTRPRKS